MKNVTITVSIRGRIFQDIFSIEKDIPEYVIADRAYRIGLMFADTQAIAIYGHRLPAHDFANFLQDLDYSYDIKEVVE